MVARDLQQRSEIAVKAAAARHNPRAYARSIVACWPQIPDEVRDELRGILAPIVNRTGATAPAEREAS